MEEIKAMLDRMIESARRSKERYEQMKNAPDEETWQRLMAAERADISAQREELERERANAAREPIQ